MYFALNVAFLLKQFDEKLAENVDTCENITKMTLHDKLFIFVLEAWSFGPHFIEVFSFQILVLDVFLHMNFVVFF